MTLLNINLENVFKSLDITWKGMLTIFLGIGVIYLAIFLLTKIKDKKTKLKQ